jgi:hypothetical protein
MERLLEPSGTAPIVKEAWRMVALFALWQASEIKGQALKTLSTCVWVLSNWCASLLHR